MAQIVQSCDSCDATVLAEVDQTVIDGDLRWYVSLRCPNCGSAVEFDDIGLPPDEIRESLIQCDGRWDLHLERMPGDAASISQVLRSALGWSLSDSLSRLKAGTVRIYSGTRVECEWLKVRLRDVAVSSKVVRSAVHA